MGNSESKPEMEEKQEEEEQDEEATDKRKFLEQEVKVEELTPNQALLIYAERGDLEKCREILRAGSANVNHPDNGPIIPEGKTPDDPEYRHQIATGDYPLHRAAQNGHLEVAQLLYLSDAKLDNKDRIGSTALHRAVANHQVAMVQLLLSWHAEVQARNNIGNTPLHVAAYVGDLEICKILLDAGSQRLVMSPNRVNMTPLDYARKASVQELLSKYTRPAGLSVSPVEVKAPTIVPSLESTSSLSFELAPSGFTIHPPGDDAATKSSAPASSAATKVTEDALPGSSQLASPFFTPSSSTPMHADAAAGGQTSEVRFWSEKE